MRKAILVFSALLLMSAAPASAKTLANFKLHPPLTERHAEYLGVPVNQPLNLSDIEADYLLVEIFSMYCPYCQAEAKHVNDLFDKITANHPDRLKLIGVGAGNTAFEVDYFREKYDIEFPVFSDSDYVIHKQVGQVGTPYFYLLEKQDDGSMKILMIQEGPYEDTETFYKRIIGETGL
jgi:thiol-disulfide isomerase/thioredoxin